MLNWLFLIFWSGLIFFFSSVPDIGKDIPSQWIRIISYLFHFGEYATLMFLAVKAFTGKSPVSKKILLWAAIFAIIFAVSDEYHQSFVIGRDASVPDLIIDVIGIFTAIIFFLSKIVSANLKIKNI